MLTQACNLCLLSWSPPTPLFHMVSKMEDNLIAEYAEPKEGSSQNPAGSPHHHLVHFQYLCADHVSEINHTTSARLACNIPMLRDIMIV